jgi:dTDP-glucose pyrophosphorylase
MTFPSPDIVLPVTASALEAMRAIDASGLEVALICTADGRLRAIVTDGDLRRAILKGQPLTTPAVEIGNQQFTSVSPSGSRADAVRLMLARSFKCVPVIDAQGVLVDLHTLHGALQVPDCGSWAVIMAGGKGERLGELTQAIPKPMLPVGDKPILEHLVHLLVGHGIRRIFLSVGYLGQMIEDHFRDGERFRCRIDYLREDQPLGTGGALSLIRELPTAPLLVMNGDLVTAVNLTRMLAFHRQNQHAATIALRDHVVKVPFGVVDTEAGRVTALREKPVLSYAINAGIYALEPRLLARIPGDRLFPITELFDDCLKRGESVGGYHLDETWNDIGLPEEYARIGSGAGTGTGT